MRNLQAIGLIELLIVLAIIGILSSTALPSLRSYTYKSRLSQIFNLATEHQRRFDRYYTENNTEPSSLDDLNIAVATVVADVKGVSDIRLDTTNNRTLIYLVDLDFLGLDTTKTLEVRFSFSETNEIINWGCEVFGEQDYLQYLPNNCNYIGGDT